MDVVCLGILVADIFCDPIDTLPAAGELKLSDRFLFSVGGCAANTAACLRRLGRTVKVLGKVGHDFLGDFVLQDLSRIGIDTGSIAYSTDYPTSSTVILNVAGEDRRFIHCVGANADFSPADVDFSILRDTRALYVGGYMAMPGFKHQDLARLFFRAKAGSLSTILDVVIPSGSIVAVEDLGQILAATDVFLPNDDEARVLTGRKNPLDQAEILGRYNPACTIAITQGRRGALVKRGSELLSAGAYQLDSVDASGAGDAFAAGFITGILENWSLEQTLRFASAVGGSCTRALGCTQGVFHFEEAVKFVEQNPLLVTRVS